MLEIIPDPNKSYATEQGLCYGSGLGLLEVEYSPKGRPRYYSRAL
jgi:hypothetical protein